MDFGERTSLSDDRLDKVAGRISWPPMVQLIFMTPK